MPQFSNINSMGIVTDGQPSDGGLIFVGTKLKLQNISRRFRRSQHGRQLFPLSSLMRLTEDVGRAYQEYRRALSLGVSLVFNR